MSINATQLAGSTPVPAAAPATSSIPGADSMGQDAFLKLLVVQLQNQDPTAPQSNTEFIAQLATFSSLQQLTSINQAVTSLVALLTGAGDAGTLTNSADTSSAIEGKA